MEKIRSTKGILDFAPCFRSGIASVLTPTRKSKLLQKVIMSIGQNDGIKEDWTAIGDDIRFAMSKYNTEMTWQRN